MRPGLSSPDLVRSRSSSPDLARASAVSLTDLLRSRARCFCGVPLHRLDNALPFDGVWVQCDGCRRWCHGQCAGLTAEQARASPSMTPAPPAPRAPARAPAPRAEGHHPAPPRFGPFPHQRAHLRSELRPPQPRRPLRSLPRAHPSCCPLRPPRPRRRQLRRTCAPTARRSGLARRARLRVWPLRRRRWPHRRRRRWWPHRRRRRWWPHRRPLRWRPLRWRPLRWRLLRRHLLRRRRRGRQLLRRRQRPRRSPGAKTAMRGWRWRRRRGILTTPRPSPGGCPSPWE